ncbi:L,D-transpeptidase [Streptomyces lasiicapitis]|uniref:L,D-transpeptidase n=1 Tax=Streptomyces lasiicapitis TaxID=1923961 RepID=UPI003320B87E
MPDERPPMRGAQPPLPDALPPLPGDQPPTPRPAEPDALSAALRGLADSGRAPAPGPGAQVRRRAVTRGRRRRATIAGGAAIATAALVFGLVTGLGDDSDPRPAQPAAPTESASTAPAVTVDLTRRTLTVRGRTLPLSSGTAAHPTKPGRMTVVAKHRTKRLTGGTAGLGDEYDVSLPWVVELRDTTGRTNYAVALTYNEQAPGKADVTRGVLGLRTSDAKWLYTQVSSGSVVTIEGKAPGAAN